MTREEKEMAIKCLKWFKDYNEEDYCSGDRIKDKYDDLYYLVTEQDFEIFDMIIGWLEKEPILDKIRAEINKLSPIPTAEDVIDGNEVKDAIWEILIEVDKIIDKYRNGGE